MILQIKAMIRDDSDGGYCTIICTQTINTGK